MDEAPQVERAHIGARAARWRFALVAIAGAVLGGLAVRAMSPSPRAILESEPRFERPPSKSQSAGEPVAEASLAVGAKATIEPPAPSSALGLELERTRIDADWARRTAVIADSATREMHEYAIGDLLPHACLLVGIDASSVDILVADRDLVRVFDDGRVEHVTDFRRAREPIRPTRAHAPNAAAHTALSSAIAGLESADPTVVQESIDDLIARSDTALEALMPLVANTSTLGAIAYRFPSTGGPSFRPRVVGEMAMMILEQITGQTFGDLARAEMTEERRTRIAESWKRWWRGE